MAIMVAFSLMYKHFSTQYLKRNGRIKKMVYQNRLKKKYPDELMILIDRVINGFSFLKADYTLKKYRLYIQRQITVHRVA
jgi:hypothetical protein